MSKSKNNVKKVKGVISKVVTACLLVVFAALLGNHVYNQVSKHLPTNDVEEGYVLHFEGGPIEELDISDIYVEGMTWSEFIYESNYLANKPGANAEYYITTTYTTSLMKNEQDSQSFWNLQLNGENIDVGSVMDLSQTYTLVAM